MRIRARTLAAAVVCLMALVITGCVRSGGGQPTPPPIQLPTALPTAGPTAGATPITDDMLSRSRDSIVRIEGTDCDRSYRTGTGFFVQPGLVATAYHVVKGQQTLAVRTLSTRGGTGHVFAGEVVGHNESADVALVRVEDAQPAVLSFSDVDPTVNAQVASIGYPEGLPINLETGRITAVDQDTVVQDGENRRPFADALRISAPPSAATSGGPLIDPSGAVSGLVVSGFSDGSQVHFAVPGTTVKALTAGWAASPEVDAPAKCQSPTTSPDQKVAVRSRHPDAPGIATALRAYFGGINAGEQIVDSTTGLTGFELAYRQLSGERLRTYPTLEKFVAAHHQRISDVVLQSVEYADDTTDTIRVSYDYVTISADGSQSACRTRSMEYSMSIDTGVWTFADQTVRKRVRC